jgi:hypothetical protein
MKSHLWAAVVLVALGACSGDPGTAPDPADILTYDPAFDVTALADGGTCPDVFQEHTQVLPNGATVTWTSGIGGFDYDVGTDYSTQVHWSVDGGTGEYTGLTERPGNGTWLPRSGKDSGVDGILMVGVAGAGFVPVTVSMDPMMSVDASGDDGDEWAGFAGTGRFWLRLAVQGGKGKARSVRLGVNVHLEDPADGYQTRCPDADDPPPPPPPPASEYTVGGTVSGLSGTVGLLNNGGDNLSVSSNSGFTFATSLANGASYAVTVGTQPAGQTCEVGSGTGTISSANVTDVSVTCADDPPPPPPPPAVSYADDVQPYFNSNCTGCHGGSNPQKGVDLTSYQQVMAGGDGGAIVIPGDPDASVLVQQLEDRHRNQIAADIAQIRTWIQEGAQNN